MREDVLQATVALSHRRAKANWSWKPEIAMDPKPESEAQGWAKAACNELMELDEALETGDMAEIQMELGDVLMCVHHAARLMGISPDTALLGSVKKIERRMDYVEARLEVKTDFEERARLWAESKRKERQAR